MDYPCEVCLQFAGLCLMILVLSIQITVIVKQIHFTINIFSKGFTTSVFHITQTSTLRVDTSYPRQLHLPPIEQFA